ncbi:MAG: radical SAM protein [Lentisphaeria bacterium]|nr:radical SAM protein [Lentisphaeria bacterium]
MSIRDKKTSEIFEVDLAEAGMSGFMVYAPLHRFTAFVRTRSEAERLVREKLDEAFRLPPEDHDFRDLTSISILPTHRCNFSCSYCYSACGRSSTTLSFSDIQCAVDYFLATRRDKTRRLHLTVLGGGEPLIVPELTLEAIRYALSASDAQGFRMNAELVTNGSLVNESICETLCRYPVSVGVSFELIPEIQRKQRGDGVETVRNNISMLNKYRIPTVIQSTITPDNVSRMGEMYELLKNDFPWVKSALFEPAVSRELFPDEKALGDFYRVYLDEFFNVKKQAEADGVRISNRSLLSLNKQSYRGCAGRFCLTPQKKISICFCTSSPEEKRFPSMCYGEIRDGQVVVDEEKFRSIMHDGDNLGDPCNGCFARWNCAGGCMLPNKVYSPAQKTVLCGFTRKLFARELFCHWCGDRTNDSTGTDTYPFRFLARKSVNNAVTYSYLFDCSWEHSNAPVTYQLNLYDIGENIFLSDYFPAQWSNDPNCTKRSTSAEGNFANVRKIVRTCFVIFLQEFARFDPDSVMVIRGNYKTTETEEEALKAVSQKSRVYHMILKKYIEAYGFEMIDRLSENVFFITKNTSDSRRDVILSHYWTFFRNKHR